MQIFEEVCYPYSPEEQYFLKSHNELFNEMLNLGVRLQTYIYKNNREKQGYSHTVIWLLYRKSLEFQDGIRVLLSSGCVTASIPIIRALLELFAQLHVIINDDSEDSANAYMFCFLKETENLSEIPLFAKVQSNWDKWQKSFNKKNKPYKKPYWYNIAKKVDTCGITSKIDALGDDFKKVYSVLSKEVHVVSSPINLINYNGQEGLAPIRKPLGEYNFCNLAGFCLATQGTIYQWMMQKYSIGTSECWVSTEKSLNELFVKLDALKKDSINLGWSNPAEETIFESE